MVNPHQPLYITDQLEMLSLMQHNVVLNGVEGRVKPLILNWCVFLPKVPNERSSKPIPFLLLSQWLLSLSVLSNVRRNEILSYDEKSFHQLADPI